MEKNIALYRGLQLEQALFDQDLNDPLSVVNHATKQHFLAKINKATMSEQLIVFNRCSYYVSQENNSAFIPSIPTYTNFFFAIYSK